jgi:acyl-CoA reductase-like NAD-dependent aldehyde dehydrogenase
VAALLRYESEAEVMARANASAYGLAAYVYGSGLRGVMRVAGALEYGMVGINTPKFTGAPVPFGGMKQSGLGREGSRHGIDDYCELKYLCLGGLG